MSKNMTRKGLAFGAGFALVASGLAAAPANAIELNENIQTEATSGPKTVFNVLAKAGQTISITSSPLSSAMAGSGEVEFDVADSASKFLPNETSTGGVTVQAQDDAAASVEKDEDLAVITIAAGVSDGTYLFHSDDNLKLDDGSGNDEVIVAKKHELKLGVVENNTLIFKSDNDINTTLQTDVSNVAGAQDLDFVKVDSSKITTTTDTIASGGSEVSTSSNNVTLTTSGVAAGTYVVHSNIDLDVSGGSDNNVKVLSASTPTIVDVSSDSFTITSESSLTSASHTVDTATELTFISTPAASGRDSDGHFAVDSGVNSSGTTAQLVLESTDAKTRTVDVTPFVDDFEDGSFDSDVEAHGSAVTLGFYERDDVSWTTTLTAPLVGATKVEATMVSSPAINGAENDDPSEFKIGFTRQGSSSTVLTTAQQSPKTAVWAAEVNTDLSSSSYAELQSDGTTSSSAWDNLTEPTGKAGDGDTGDSAASGDIVELSFTTKGLVTVKTGGAHGLLTGDEIEMAIDSSDDSALAKAAETDNVEVTVLDSTTFTYSMSETGDSLPSAAASSNDLHSGTAYTVETHEANSDGSDGDGAADRIFAGDYSARAYIEDLNDGNWFAEGAASKLGTAAVVAADTLITTVASANVQGAQVNDATDSGTDSKIRVGTTSASVTATVLDKDGDAVGAGRPVVVDVESTTDSDVTVATEKAGKSETLYTDANGQVTIAISHTGTSADGDKADFTVTPEGVDAAKTRFTMEWDKAKFTIVDLSDTKSEIGGSSGDVTEKRSILENGTYVIQAYVADQWYVAADSDTYRIQVTGQGVTESNKPLTDGRADITVTDAGVDKDYNSVLTLQKLSSGVYSDVVAKTINTLVDKDASISLAADGGSFDGATADLSEKVAAKAIVERDVRKEFVSKPSYGQSALIAGKVVDATTGVSIKGATVTISGPNSILFEHGSKDVAQRGSITFVADGTDGEFHVDLYSTTAQKDTVITVSAMGVEKTTKVTFTGKGVGEGTVLTIDSPANVQPATTFQVTATLADAFGNGVDTSADRIKITRTGSGITFGTLPTQTDANGEASFSVLLGANDTADITVTVSYDQNGDGDYKDKKDLTTTKTITVGDAPATKKVNAGSFKDYVAVYARGYEGQRLSAKIGNDWVIVDPIVNNESADLHRTTDFTGAGVDIAVRIYIDRVLIDTIDLTTK